MVEAGLMLEFYDKPARVGAENTLKECADVKPPE
jgi:hypothetical protein